MKTLSPHQVFSIHFKEVIFSFRFRLIQVEVLLPKRIMIIDDDSVWFLYQYHFSLIPDIEIIAEFENAKDALLQIPFLKPEVVIADYTLPEMTGIELAEQLLPNREIKVLFVTGHNLGHINSELKGSGHAQKRD